MISYYRVYYDLEMANVSDTKWLFIHTPLPAFQMTQQELCDFVNENINQVSLKCELNKDIYAVARIIPFKKETRLPIYRHCFLDVFMFLTPIRNKIPSYVETTSIKTVVPIITRSKIDQLDPSALTVLDRLVTPNIESDSSVVEYYKTNGLEYQQSNGNLQDVVTLNASDYTFESLDQSATTNQLSKYIMIRISVDGSNLYGQNLDITFSNSNEYLQPPLTKMELFRLISSRNSGYIVIDDTQSMVFIDCQDNSAAYVAMKGSDWINATTIDITSLNDQLPTTMNPLDPYVSNVYVYDSNSSILSAIQAITDFGSSDKLGNMYVITDYDTAIMESIFQNLLLGL